MGKLIDITPFERIGVDDIAEERKRIEANGERRIIVKAERPKEITERALVNIEYHEWKRYKHGELEVVIVEEWEIPGVLAILRGNADMNVRQALEDLRFSI